MNIRTLTRTAVITTGVAAAALTNTPKLLAEDSVNGVWTGATGDGLWATAGNWESGAVPSGADATVFFPSGTNTSVRLPAQAVTINTLSGATNFTLLTAAGQTFTLKDASGFGGTIDLRGGTLSLSGTGNAVVSNLLATSLSTFAVQNASATVTVARASGTAELDKTGPGFLRLNHASIADRQNAQVVLRAGSLEFAAAEIPASVLDQAWFHIDASQTNTMTFATHNGTNFITRLNDVRGNGRYAFPSSGDNYTSTTAPHAPWLQNDMQNGRPVIDFGTPAGDGLTTNGVAIGYNNVWGATMKWNTRCSSVRDVFLIISDREECENLSGTWPFLLGDETYYHFHRGGSAKLFDGNADPAVRNGTILFDGKSATVDTPFLPIGFHALTLMTTGGVVYANAFAQDRNHRYGGQRLAEAVIYTNHLEACDAQAVQFSLASKWLPQVAKSTALTLSGGTLVIPQGTTLCASNLTVSADTTVTGGGTLLIQSGTSVSGTLTAENVAVRFQGNASLDKLSINQSNLTVSANATAKMDTLNVSAETLVKQGSGTIQCGFLGGTLRSIAVEEGAVQLTGWPRNTWLHIDASQTNTMTFAAQNGTNFITRLNDVYGNGRYATSPGSNGSTSPRQPWLQKAFQNSRPVIDFGSPSGVGFNDSTGAQLGYTNGWGGCLTWSERCTGVSSVFMVVSDREDFSTMTGCWPFFVGDLNTYMFHRDSNAKFFATIANPGLLQGKILFDGQAVTYASAFLPIGFHTLALIPTNAVYAQTFANDRNLRYGGQRLAEAIICTNVPSATMQTNILAYFDAKWLGKTVTNGVGYAFDALTVAAGATLDIGLSPMSAGVSTANALTGAGTVKTATLAVKALSPAGSDAIGHLKVDGNLTLATNAVVTLDTSATALDTVAVSGTLAIEPNGTFNVGVLSTVWKAPNKAAIITAGSVTGAENLTTWRYTGDLAKRYSCRVLAEGGTVYLEVASRGTLVIVR